VRNCRTGLLGKPVLTLLSHCSSHLLNMSDMARALEVSVSTVKDYLDIIHHTFPWRNLPPFPGNPLKKIQKAKKGFFRDTGLLHYLLRLGSLDDLLFHPAAGFSFESFVIEEIIRGMQSTMAVNTDFSYYRTGDKSEVDLIIEGFFGRASSRPMSRCWRNVCRPSAPVWWRRMSLKKPTPSDLLW
jgi:uncharacterized protein